jgi:hypothetical protein
MFLSFSREFNPPRHIHYDARVTLKTYLTVERIGNKFLVLSGHHNGYSRLNGYFLSAYYGKNKSACNCIVLLSSRLRID